MANVDRKKGAVPVRYRSGAPYNGAANMYVLPSTDGTAVFIGDFVKHAGGGGGAGEVTYGQDLEGVPTIAQAGANDTLIGVVVGFLPNQDNLAQRHRPASTRRVALVADDPDLLFEIQEDGVGGELAAVDIGLNAQIIVSAGNAVTGMSGMELDSSTKATTNSHELKIVGLAKRPDNAFGDKAKWLVTINKHHFDSIVVGV